MLFAETTEYGKLFKTGVPVRVRFVRNTKRAPPPQLNDPYQQRIEPLGRYVLHNPDPTLLPVGWEVGTVYFRNPLVLQFNKVSGNYYDEHSWKKQLEHHYAKRGRPLSKAIVRDGYDGVVTVVPHVGDTREIVDLTWLIS